MTNDKIAGFAAQTIKSAEAELCSLKSALLILTPSQTPK